MQRINRHAPLSMRVAQLTLAAALAVLVSACGGGGGDAAGTPVVGSGSTGGGTTTVAAKMTLALSSTTVTAASPATVTATVKTPAGSPIPGQVVTFTTAGSLGSFSPSSALTDANGVASVIVKPASSTTAGADTITASTTVDSQVITASTGFQLTATDVTISSFSADVSTLSAGGQTTLTVALTGTSSSSPVNVNLSSACATNSRATLTPTSVTTSTGKATFTLRDTNCGSYQTNDTLVATVSGSTASSTLTLPVSSPKVSSISFVSSSPQIIYLKGTGNTESSDVTFRVKDETNNGVPNQTVLLETTTQAGGLTLDGVSAVGSTPPQVTKLSDSNGDVIVRINSGTVPTPVRVKATLQGSNISTVSSALAIAVGLPSQLNFSLAQGTHNIEGFDIQGTANTYTILAADRLGNPVPDGTAINFVLEAGGQVQAIKTTALNGSGLASATANFASASPVPSDGRITVVAYALGEESFLDLNGNNVYDAGEPYQDLGDVYIDRHFHNYYNADRDQYISLSVGAGAKACSPWATEPGATLLATGVSIPTKPGSCDQAWGKNYVRRAIQTVLSKSTPRAVWGTALPTNVGMYASSCPAPVSLTAFDANGLAYTQADPPVALKQSYYPIGQHSIYASSAGGSIYFLAADANGEAFNPMPAGTTVSASGTDGLSVTVAGGSPIPSSINPTGVALNYKFDDKTTSGTITINFTAPSGLTTAVTQFISIGTASGTRCN